MSTLVRPRLAAIVTAYFKYSHAQHIVDRLLDGYGWNGTHHYPPMDLVSLYVDQTGSNDLSRERASRHCKMDGGWDLGRDVVVRERADQTDGRVRCARRDYGEVGMLGFADIGQAVEAAAELHDSTALTQGVERVGVHPVRDHIASAQRTALVAENLECGVEISGLHGG